MPEVSERDIDPNPDPGDAEEAIELSERAEDWLDPAARAAHANAVEAGTRIMRTFAGHPDPSVEARQLPREGILVQNFIMTVNQADPEQAQQLQRLQQDVATLRQQVQAIHDGPAIGPIRIKYVLIACGVLGGLSGALSIIFTLKNNLAGPARRAAAMWQPMHPADPSDVNTVKRFWLKNSEEEFWRGLASFAEAEKPRPFQEQLFFAQQTLDLANAMQTVSWRWNSPGDRISLTDQFEAIIRDKGVSAAYRAVSTIPYGANAAPLPRSVAAEVLSLALVRWWINYA